MWCERGEDGGKGCDVRGGRMRGRGRGKGCDVREGRMRGRGRGNSLYTHVALSFCRRTRSVSTTLLERAGTRSPIRPLLSGYGSVAMRWCTWWNQLMSTVSSS